VPEVAGLLVCRSGHTDSPVIQGLNDSAWRGMIRIHEARKTQQVDLAASARFRDIPGTDMEPAGNAVHVSELLGVNSLHHVRIRKRHLLFVPPA